ncbi:thioesterase II family protein [Chryseobacterium jejuense]|uniref:thioesterase II family protein n=1 Tax=Chryseobacterium jejuense TaxID=445960 RepID=UPI001AE257A6|nr:thioesterase [Chryseobacterium jejuense]MBP2617311.1 surfactin synthase thioesterase subunit [Chryseobacterium jejuense]
MNTATSSKPQIFLLHYAGGDRNSFRPLIENLQSHFQVETPELPGRGDRMSEPPLKNKKEALTDVLEQIKQVRNKNVPYLIYGHSMGAILGFEICYAMEKDNDVPVHFVATGYPGPGIKESIPIAHLPKTEFFAEVRKLGGISDEVMQYEELLDFFEPLLRGDFGLLENKSNQIPNIKIQTPIYAIMGKNEKYALNIRNWANYTETECECQIVNGNHFFINQNFNYLSQVIKNLMNTAIAK